MSLILRVVSEEIKYIHLLVLLLKRSFRAATDSEGLRKQACTLLLGGRSMHAVARTITILFEARLVGTAYVLRD